MTDIKICPRCTVCKTLNDYYILRTGKPKSHCKDCCKEESLRFFKEHLKEISEKRKKVYCAKKTHRTSFDRNEFIQEGNLTKILLYKRDGVTPNGETILDTEDYQKVSAHKWHESGGYAMSRVEGQLFFLHHLIIGREEKKVVDHINRNRLDNRKSNLRIISQADNTLNVGLRSDNKSGYKGISWSRHCKKWLVSISRGNIELYHGYFIDKQDAVNKRKELEKEFHQIKVSGQISPS